MRITRIGLGVVGFGLAVASTLVVATVWLLVTDPVTVADAVGAGAVSPALQALAAILLDAFIDLIGYL